MGEKTTKTRAELLEMLAQAVRNTQPQPVSVPQPEPIRDAQPKIKTRPVHKRSAKTKLAQAPVGRKPRR
jgi:hypothetical protein